MSDTEKQELDRWLEWAGGDVSTWTPQRPGSGPAYEARVRKDGRVLRHITADRHEAIRLLRDTWEAAPLPGAAAKTRCASCPRDAVETIALPVSRYAAMQAGLTPTGRALPDMIGSAEEVALCGRCLASELQDLLRRAGAVDPGEVARWVRKVRAFGP